jgi:hypothetical protein
VGWAGLLVEAVRATPLGVLDAFHRLLGLVYQCVEVCGQAFTRLGVEYPVFLQERDFLLGFLAVFCVGAASRSRLRILR